MSVAPPARVVPVPTSGNRRTIGPRLRVLLLMVFLLVALLAANSLYLLSVSLLTWSKGRSYENLFFLWMFGLHLAIGLLLVVPFPFEAGSAPPQSASSCDRLRCICGRPLRIRNWCRAGSYSGAV